MDMGNEREETVKNDFQTNRKKMIGSFKKFFLKASVERMQREK